MKLPLSPGEYLFVTGLIYFCVGMYNVFVDKFIDTEILQIIWLSVLLIPVLLPIKRFVRGSPFWKS